MAKEDILMWGHRVVIPTRLRNQILQELHTGHFSVVRMKSRARSIFYWPEIDRDRSDHKKLSTVLKTQTRSTKEQFNIMDQYQGDVPTY
ncbi:hypothetical protein NQ315_017374 [Exocentrus adspersus]|uniref:RNA-directed DNA polymerase n=1 Tax=Exocentrus adspersus TaxID=1586481 RepID=A0AAV8VLC2_9CUCU|nr:hypothetical protein NQ315_017374 [Exocentrus adspersus]